MSVLAMVKPFDMETCLRGLRTGKQGHSNKFEIGATH